MIFFLKIQIDKFNKNATINDSTYHIKLGLMMTYDFKVGNDCKQRDRIASILFNVASEYVIRQMSVMVKSTITNQ